MFDMEIKLQSYGSESKFYKKKGVASRVLVFRIKVTTTSDVPTLNTTYTFNIEVVNNADMENFRRTDWIFNAFHMKGLGKQILDGDQRNCSPCGCFQRCHNEIMLRLFDFHLKKNGARQNLYNARHFYISSSDSKHNMTLTERFNDILSYLEKCKLTLDSD